MPNKLFLQLTDDPAELVNWLILNENGNLIAGPSKSSINEVPTLAREDQVLAIVPGQDVFLTEVKLPRLSRRKLMKAVPFALEEHLAADINTLHFAIGKIGKDHHIVFVAVVSKEKMDLWRSQLEHFCKPPHPTIILLPETLALPWQSETWTILLDHPNALVRTGLQVGFSVEVANLWKMLHLLLKQPDKPHPATIALIGELTPPDTAVNFSNQWGILLKQRKLVADKLSFMAGEVDKSTAFNLLQGDYEIDHYLMQARALYRIAAVLAGIWFVMLTIGSLTQLFILDHRENKLQKQIMASYATIFPKSVVANPKERMQKELQSLRSNQVRSGFLHILSTLAPIVAQMHQIKLLGLDYAENQLTLSVEADDFSTLDQITETLQMQNLKTEQRDAVRSGNYVHARLFIQEID